MEPQTPKQSRSSKNFVRLRGWFNTFINTVGTICSAVAATIAKVFIYIYRATVSPSVGVFRYLPGYTKPSCVFYPTCSAYALTCFKKYPFGAAFNKTMHRIHRCHPGTEPMVDMP